MKPGSPWQPLWRLRVSMRWLRWLSHRQRQTLLMMLLALATGLEFLENIMFVFASSHIVGASTPTRAASRWCRRPTPWAAC